MALRDIPDEAVEGMLKQPESISESLTEGKSFDIYNLGNIDRAKEFFDSEVNVPETEIKVIDVDANAVEHLKDKASYIGQAILSCNKCKSNLFIDMDKLEPDENDSELFNLETECPHCHTVDTGYSLIGQVGKVAEEEVKEEEVIEETPSEEAEETIEEPIESEEAASEESKEEFTFEEEPAEEETFTFDNSESESEEESEEVAEEEPAAEIDMIETEEESNPMETSESEEEIEKEVTTKDGKKLKLKIKKLGDVYEESFEEDEDEVKESLVEEVTPEYVENTNGKDAWMMGQVIQYMNDETAYFDSGWLYLWPDGESEEECYEDFSDQEDYEDLKNKFERVYRRFHSGGLYDAPADVEAYAHEVDKRLGLKPIDNLQKVIDFNSYEPLHESETIDEFLKKINHPERIDKVIIAKKDYDVFDDSKMPIFEGMCDDLEPRMKSCNVKCFDVGDGFLTCNIDSTKHEAPQNLKSFLDKYDNDKSEKVVLWDLDTCDQCYQGPKKDAIDRFGDCEFYCVEAPKVLVIKLDDEEADKKELPEIKAPVKSEEDKFVDRVYQVNHLNPYAKNDPNSDEYWISEGIKNKENLKTIFEKYIKPLGDKRLTETFKNLTSYKEAKFSLKKFKITESVEDLGIKDKWVEISNYETMVEFGKGTKWGVSQADKEGEKYFDDYSAQGKFFARVIDGKRQLKFAPDDSDDVIIFDEDMKEIKESLTESIKLDNDQLAYAINTGWKQAFKDLGKTASIEDFETYFDNSILADTNYDETLLKRLLRNKLIKTKIYGNKVVEDFEADDEIEDVEEDEIVESKQPSFRSFKTRKELSKAITECKNKTQPYTIRRSVVEGYRYDLILNEGDSSLRYNPDDYKADDLDAYADRYEEEKAELIDITDDDVDYIDDDSDEFELEFDPEVYQTGRKKLTEAEEEKIEPNKDDDKESADKASEETKQKESEPLSDDRKELEQQINKLENADSYTSFVKLLQSDQKSQAFLDFLQKHYGEKDYIGTLRKSNSKETTFKCKDLEITQNNISLSKSLSGPLSKDFNWLSAILNSPESAFNDPVITYAGKYIIDGHHRWSKVYALNGPDASVKAIDFPEISGVSWKDMLKAVQLANLASNPSYPLVNEVGDDNMLSMSEKDIADYVKSVIKDEAIEVYKKFKSDLDSTDKVAGYCGKNGKTMQSTCGGYNGKPPRSVMPQTDKAAGSIDKLGKVVYDVSEALEDDEFDLELIDDDNDEIEIVDAEIIDEPEQRSDDTRITNLSPIEIETVEKIGRISRDIVNAVKDTYNIDIDPELVAADILQDLRLISHDIRPDQLRRTASNVATIDMFHSFEETMDVIDQLMELFTGQTIESTPERRLAQAIRMLDSEAFTTQAIYDGIRSDRFIEAAQAGAVPYITASDMPQLQEALLDSPVNLNIDLHNFGGSGNDVDVGKMGSDTSSNNTSTKTEGLLNLPVNVNIDAHEFGGNNNDVDIMGVGGDKKVSEEIDNEDDIEFPAEEFDHEMSDYFTEAYYMKVNYRTIDGYVDLSGNILLEGIISTPDSENKKDLDINFILNPITKLTENINDKNILEQNLLNSTYKVSNNLSNEIFEFSVNK